MDLITIGVLGIIVLLLSLFILRLPVGFAMAIIGYLGFGYVINFKAASSMLADECWKVFSSYGLTVIPLFILMGQICFYAGVNKRLYETAYHWFGHIKGGLVHATILACAGFAAICGSNTATAATMSTVALPEMQKFKYHPLLSTASVAVGATLGVVIPPSVVLIIIGLQTGQSIAVLFWASFIPGVLLTIFFMLAVGLFCHFRPDFAPAAAKSSWKERFISLKGSIEMLVLFGLVMTGLLAGFFTPSQAGGVGAFLALIIAVLRKQLSFRNFILALEDTLKVTSMIMVIILGAIIFGRFLAVTRLPYELAVSVSSWHMPSYLIMSGIALIYIIGGAVMDALALLIITIPIFFPLATSLGYSPIWFAVFITIVTTLGAVTPPVGINTFIVASMAKDVSMKTIFKGILLFMPCYLVLLFCLLFWPELGTLGSVLLSK
ncbi:TRAP transporter large permease [Desulfonauticus submarinus]